MPPAATTAAGRARTTRKTRPPARPDVRPSQRAVSAAASLEATLLDTTVAPRRGRSAVGYREPTVAPRREPTVSPRRGRSAVAYREPTVAPRREPMPPRGQPVAPARRPVTPRTRVEPAPKHRRKRSLSRPLNGLAHAVLPKQTWIDRIVRGRAWIPVFGALLVAIVGMRVEVLKLSSRVGTQIQQAAVLQSSNAVLRSTVSELSGSERIETLAEQLGMVMPGPMDVHFVSASAGKHVHAAIRAIHAPAPSSYLTGLADERQADQTNLQIAADTSAVGILADSVPSYGQTAQNGIASTPPASALSSSTDSTTSTSAAATSTAASASPSTTPPSLSTTATVTASPSAAQTQPASSGQVTVSAPGPGTADPPTSSVVSGATDPPTSSVASGTTDPPTSSASSTAAGSQSGSTSGGTSLSG